MSLKPLALLGASWYNGFILRGGCEMGVPGIATIREGSIWDSYFASAKREDVDSFWENFPENSEEND